MNILKTYISIAVINVICIICVVHYGPSLKRYVFSTVVDQASPVEGTITPVVVITAVPSATPIPPKKRIVRVVRSSVSPLPAAATGDSHIQAPDSQANSGGSTQQPPAAIPTGVPTQDTRCIIGIDGVQYDVSAYRSMHPGGDIFNCGADMSGAFWSQHGAGTLNKMAKYRL